MLNCSRLFSTRTPIFNSAKIINIIITRIVGKQPTGSFKMTSIIAVFQRGGVGTEKAPVLAGYSWPRYKPRNIVSFHFDEGIELLSNVYRWRSQRTNNYFCGTMWRRHPTYFGYGWFRMPTTLHASARWAFERVIMDTRSRTIKRGGRESDRVWLESFMPPSKMLHIWFVRSSSGKLLITTTGWPFVFDSRIIHSLLICASSFCRAVLILFHWRSGALSQKGVLEQYSNQRTPASSSNVI